MRRRGECGRCGVLWQGVCCGFWRGGRGWPNWVGDSCCGVGDVSALIVSSGMDFVVVSSVGALVSGVCAGVL
jgi:hypothetical protein